MDQKRYKRYVKAMVNRIKTIYYNINIQRGKNNYDIYKTKKHIDPIYKTKKHIDPLNIIFPCWSVFP